MSAAALRHYVLPSGTRVYSSVSARPPLSPQANHPQPSALTPPRRLAGLKPSSRPTEFPSTDGTSSIRSRLRRSLPSDTCSARSRSSSSSSQSSRCRPYGWCGFWAGLIDRSVTFGVPSTRCSTGRKLSATDKILADQSVCASVSRWKTRGPADFWAWRQFVLVFWTLYFL